MDNFKILSTQGTLYLDSGGNPIQGFRIRVELIGFNETHDLNVPSMDAEVVKAAINKLIEQRKALQSLGGS